jgi:hypothetical protein
MRLVVVGGVAAGTKAASRARRLDPEMEITVYQEEPEPSISECGLPTSSQAWSDSANGSSPAPPRSSRSRT